MAGPDEALPRLAADTRLVGLIRSPLGAALVRPWFDGAALWALRRWVFPLSRMWAAAQLAEGDPGRFLAAVPMDPAGPVPERTVARALAAEARRRAAAEAAARRWDDAFFGDTDPGAAALVAAETARRDRSHDWMMTRRTFARLALRQPVPPVRWQVPAPDEVEAVHGGAIRSAAAFAPPDPMPPVVRSHAVPGPAGREYWLRFPSPSARLGDTVTAHVREPEQARDAPSLIFGHGVCVEPDHWKGIVDETADLVAAGIRVVRPEAPWHGHRALPGHYGGEPFIARAPMGVLDLMTAQVRETAVLIDWCRSQGTGAVAIGGTSLGAFVAQLAACRARDWPARLRPDALFLVTHGARLEAALCEGALAEAAGVTAALAAAGWSPDMLARYAPLMNPEGAPAPDPGRIVSVLGRRDSVTPFADGRALVEAWGVPRHNLFLRDGGHFSTALGLLRAAAPLHRVTEVLRQPPPRP